MQTFGVSIRMLIQDPLGRKIISMPSIRLSPRLMIWSTAGTNFVRWRASFRVGRELKIVVLGEERLRVEVKQPSRDRLVPRCITGKISAKYIQNENLKWNKLLISIEEIISQSVWKSENTFVVVSSVYYADGLSVWHRKMYYTENITQRTLHVHENKREVLSIVAYQY